MKIQLDKIDLPTKDLRATIDEDALDELADSMRDRGQLQPIGIRAAAGDRYEVVFGARRYRAAKLNGWTEIEANITEAHDDENTAADKLIENVQRQDLTPIEEAYGIFELIGDEQPDIRKLQRQTGKSRAWILSRLELIELPEDIQGAVQAGVLGLGVAKALATIENQQVREQYTQHAVDNGCTTDLAQIWANQAKFAEAGIIAVEELETRNRQILDQSPIAEQHYNCFVCSSSTSWRRVNALMVCADCQDAVTANRHTYDPDPPPTPLDNGIENP